MVRNASGRDNEPDPGPEIVLDALADDAAQAIISELDEPMTASELSDACDIPLSTTYRKLELLTDAALLSESTEIRRDGQHTTRYTLAFEEIRVRLTESRTLSVDIERKERGRDERLAELWKEVQEEA